MRTLRVRLLLLLLVILAIKAAVFQMDSRPAFFIGDSGSYLYTAATRWIPDDRSFVYGFFLRRVAFKLHSMTYMVAVQAFLSGLSAWLLSVYLIRYFKAAFWIAAVSGLLCAIEPLQLVSERFVMTETLATFLFCSYFGLALEYLRSGKLRWLLWAQVAGVCLLTIRMSFLANVLAFSVLLALLRPAGKSRFRVAAMKNVFVHLVIALVLSQTLLYGYRVWYGHLAKKPPAYLYADGFFLVGFWAPIIKPVDYPVPESRASIFTNLTSDPRDPKTRYQQRWDDNGLCQRIISQFTSKNGYVDVYRANAMAKRVAIHAALRDPIGLAGLAIYNFRDYLKTNLLREYAATDEGMGSEVPALREELSKYFGFSAASLYEPSVTKTWHLKALGWYQFQMFFLAVSPLFAVFCSPVYRRQMLICAIAALFFLAGAIVTVERPTPRYLTTSAWLIVLMIGASLRIFRRAARASDDSILENETIGSVRLNVEKPTVGLCLLVWNEVEGCRYDLPNLQLNQFDEVFAVDGGSKDGTIEYLEEQGIRVVRQQQRGYNRAYFSAYENSTADALIFYHPKGSIDPKFTLQFRQHFNDGADLVVASRNMAGSRNEEDSKLLKPRKWFVDGLALLTATLWWREGTYVRDVLHGFRGMRRDSFWRMEPLPEGLSMDLQMVARSYKFGFRRAEFPVEEVPRLAGDTHFKALPTGYKLLKYVWFELWRPAVGRSSSLGATARVPDKTSTGV